MHVFWQYVGKWYIALLYMVAIILSALKKFENKYLLSFLWDSGKQYRTIIMFCTICLQNVLLKFESSWKLLPNNWFVQLISVVNCIRNKWVNTYESKEVDKDQESIQSRITHDPRQRMEKWQNTVPRKHYTQHSQEASPFPVGDHKAARNINNKDKRDLSPTVASDAVRSKTVVTLIFQ